MKKIFLILFAVVICICATSCEKEEKLYPKPVIVEPDTSTYKTANGYKPLTSSPSETPDVQNNSDDSSENSVKYVGNRETKKFHKSDCRYAKNLAEEKKVSLMDYSSAISSGYTPCKVCNK